MRVRFSQAVTEQWPHRGTVSKPGSAPAGYTPNTVVTEWLTLNCRAAWAAFGQNRRIDVRFSQADDAARARNHFSSVGLWDD